MGTVRLTVDLPRNMHRRFKIACTVAGTKMNDAMSDTSAERNNMVSTGDDSEQAIWKPSLDFHGSTNDAFPLRAPRQNP